MSLIRRYRSADAALAALALKAVDDELPVVRLTLTDGAVLRGHATIIANDEITVAQKHGVPRQVPFTDIQTLEVRESSRRREWLVASVCAMAAVALLVGAASVPLLERIRSGELFFALYVAAAGAAPFILSNTPLGRWLRPWRVLYTESRAGGP